MDDRFHAAQRLRSTGQKRAANLCRDLPPNFRPGFALIPFRYRRFPGEGSSGRGLGKGCPSPNPLAKVRQPRAIWVRRENFVGFTADGETFLTLRRFLIVPFCRRNGRACWCGSPETHN
jgi:hypothetical protein